MPKTRTPERSRIYICSWACCPVVYCPLQIDVRQIAFGKARKEELSLSHGLDPGLFEFCDTARSSHACIGIRLQLYSSQEIGRHHAIAALKILKLLQQDFKFEQIVLALGLHSYGILFRCAQGPV